CILWGGGRGRSLRPCENKRSISDCVCACVSLSLCVCVCVCVCAVRVFVCWRCVCVCVWGAKGILCHSGSVCVCVCVGCQGAEGVLGTQRSGRGVWWCE